MLLKWSPGRQPLRIKEGQCIDLQRLPYESLCKRVLSCNKRYVFTAMTNCLCVHIDGIVLLIL